MANHARSGKGSKSSKTARVLSLITDPDSAEAPPAENEHTKAAAQSEAPAPAPAPAPAAAPQENLRATEANAEASLRNALESELAALWPEPQPAARSEPEPIPEPEPASMPEPMPEPIPQPEPIPEPEPAPEPEPLPEPQPTPEPQPAPMPQPEPVPAPQPAPMPEPMPEPAPAPQPAPMPEPEPEPVPAPQPEPEPQPQSTPQPVQEEPAPVVSRLEDAPEDRYMVLNVTQALVEEKAKKYMTMFGMCTCERCRIDVIALALSNLPAKYVVVHGKDINPRLSFYESKYSAAVITAVMTACKRVLDKPHHRR